MHHQVGPSQDHNDAVERVLRQAEMSRLTRNLKSKLALASMQAQHGPAASQTPPPAAATRRRAKTLEGASSAPRFLAASEPARRPNQQKRYSLPSASPRGSTSGSTSTSTNTNGSASMLHRTTPSRSSSRPISRTPSVSAIPPMPTLPTFFIGDAQASYATPAPPPPLPQPGTSSNANASASASAAAAHNAAAAAVHNGAAAHSEATAAAAAAAAAASASAARGKAGYSEANAASSIRRARPHSTPADGSLVTDSSVQQPREHEEALPAMPQTPPQRRRASPRSPRENPQTPERRREPEDGASLLLHFAHSPGHAVTPRTPDFNMSDYLHFQTPSPARPVRMGTPRRANHWGSLTSLSSLSSNIFVPTQGAAAADSAHPTPVKTSGLLSPTQHPPMPSFPAGARAGLEKSPSDL